MRISRSAFLLAFIAAGIVASCATLQRSAAQGQPLQGNAADAIYVGGDIVTINDTQPTAEAVAVKDGKILAVGARAEIEKCSLATSLAPSLHATTLAHRADNGQTPCRVSPPVTFLDASRSMSRLSPTTAG